MKQDIEREIKWHEQKFYIDSGHWSSLPIFASRERHWFANCLEKIRFYGYMAKFMKKNNLSFNSRVLIAPVGNGLEIQFLQGLYNEVYGVDISEKVLSDCPGFINKKNCDIRNIEYEDNSFDLIVCPLFLHHVHKIGFHKFICEYYRLLKPGGALCIEEPTCFFPFNLLINFIKLFTGNVTGLVPDEKPVNPLKMKRILKRFKFRKIEYRGLLFSHVRFPLIIQFIIGIIDWPFRVIFPLNIFAARGAGTVLKKSKIGVL